MAEVTSSVFEDDIGKANFAHPKGGPPPPPRNGQALADLPALAAASQEYRSVLPLTIGTSKGEEAKWGSKTATAPATNLGGWTQGAAPFLSQDILQAGHLVNFCAGSVKLAEGGKKGGFHPAVRRNRRWGDGVREGKRVGW
mmetsp:Transcript_93987/g.196087  ORF Transcript_93987/g.196087 Transcript_93987/m.196087 type:complete len:141 (-) Transcript_93987:167-589(-)|eukprot:CAMPEP_0206471248 /NCGR_PEP_ID=MMETSP0324_2-20121206/31437_1 /ASSEMBLY_ACC=CAM_ASM_000836 /TAXON_ID=2866 /ORGANISM="Crypthecodinium cohnii, Strain Seligo" /LENGTH=140 /DNA_ID=CAMNT_0053945511 /DNA_START=429 /DNA_END=851 /DNA_ORIENTATION=+